MCLLLFAYNAHPNYKLILAANRDEFYERETKPLHNWKENSDLYAGKDLKEGGTWLGITSKGKIAAITNYRDMSKIKSNAPTRGKLITDFLLNKVSPERYSAILMKTAEKYNGYNLIFGRMEDLFYFSNETKETLKLSSAIYGLSNHLLDTPWPKVKKSRKRFIEILEEPVPSKYELFELLKDNEIYPDEDLPETGLPKDLERMVSPIFTVAGNYGTRSSSVIFIDKDDNVQFIEKSLNNYTKEWETSSFNFKIEKTIIEY
jgi:uncharacterized protein with NRDE domain